MFVFSNSYIIVEISSQRPTLSPTFHISSLTRFPVYSLMYKASGKGATNGHRFDDEGTRWSRAHTEVNRVSDNFYYGLGLRVAQNPLKTLTICFCCIILCCLGFLNFAVVTRGESLNETNI